MQLVVPRAVNAAVRMDTTTWMMSCQRSLFFIIVAFWRLEVSPLFANIDLKMHIWVAFSSSFSSSFCPICSFFLFFLKKNDELLCQFRKRSYLCTRFPKNLASESSAKYTWAMPSAAGFRLKQVKEGGKNEIFDRLRTEIQDKQRVHIIYNVYAQAKSIPINKKLWRE